MGCGASAASPQKYETGAPATETKPVATTPAEAKENAVAANPKQPQRRSVSFGATVDVVQVDGAEEPTSETTPKRVSFAQLEPTTEPTLEPTTEPTSGAEVQECIDATEGGEAPKSSVAENTPHIGNKLKGKDTYSPAEAAEMFKDRPSVSDAADLGTSVQSVVSLAESDGTSAKRLSNVGSIAVDLRVLASELPPMSPDSQPG